MEKEIAEGKAAKDDLVEAKKKYTTEGLQKIMGGNPQDLLPITLGVRHMLQMVFDVRKIAIKHKKDPKQPKYVEPGAMLDFPHLSDAEIMLLLKSKVIGRPKAKKAAGG